MRKENDLNMMGINPSNGLEKVEYKIISAYLGLNFA